MSYKPHRTASRRDRVQALWLTLFFLPLLSCGPKGYTAQECREIAAPKAFLDRCMGGKVTGSYVGDVKCWPFSRPQRLRGVWVGGPEASEFFPGATTYKQVKNAKGQIWLEVDLQHPLQTEPTQPVYPRAYFLDAEGRLSVCDGWFGHLSMYPREFIVDRIYYLRQIAASYRKNYADFRPRT